MSTIWQFFLNSYFWAWLSFCNDVLKTTETYFLIWRLKKLKMLKLVYNFWNFFIFFDLWAKDDWWSEPCSLEISESFIGRIDKSTGGVHFGWTAGIQMQIKQINKFCTEMHGRVSLFFPSLSRHTYTSTTLSIFSCIYTVMVCSHQALLTAKANMTFFLLWLLLDVMGVTDP